MNSKDEESIGIRDEKVLHVYDLHSHFVMPYPQGFKSTTEAYVSLKHYAGQQKVLRF